MTLLILATFALAAAGADLKVDHITIAGSDLTALRAMFAKAGIETEFGGKHSNGQTEMALASFADGSYLELIAPQTGADVSSHYWGAFMMKNAGPCAWAISSVDIAADKKRLEAAGVGIQAQRNGRTRPDGVELKWETANAGPGSPGSFFPFLIHDETPRERRVYPSGKPTTAKISGVRFVLVAVRNLPDAVAKYRAAFSLAEPRMQDDVRLGAKLAWFADSPVILAAASSENTWVARRLKQFGEAPCAFVLDSRDRWPGRTSPLFSHPVVWLDQKVGGMRIGVSP